MWPAHIVRRVRELAAQGVGRHKIRAEVGIKYATVQKILGPALRGRPPFSRSELAVFIERVKTYPRDSRTGKFLPRAIILVLLLVPSAHAGWWDWFANFFTSPLQITTTALPIGKTSVLYSASLTATGGKQPYRWTASGLPTGLTLSGATISGTSSLIVNGVPITVTLRDKTNNTVQGTFPLAICAPLTIVTASLPPGQVGVAYSAQIQSSGGVASVSPAACNPL